MRQTFGAVDQQQALPPGQCLTQCLQRRPTISGQLQRRKQRLHYLTGIAAAAIEPPDTVAVLRCKAFGHVTGQSGLADPGRTDQGHEEALGKLPHHWNVATVDLEPVYAAVEEYAHVIDRAVQQLREAAGAERVTLVAHSMGGLAARAYLRAHEHSCVQRVVTIDTPHHGTVFARYAHGANSRQMRRACDFVQQLAQREEPVEFVCFASQHDNLIVPRDSQVLDCAEAVWFEKIGHLAMTDDDRVLAKLIQVVERPHADAVAAQPLAAA